MVVVYGSYRPFQAPASCDSNTGPSLYMTFHGGKPEVGLFSSQKGENGVVRFGLDGSLEGGVLKSRGVMIADPRGMAFYEGRLYLISAWRAASRILQFSCCTPHGGARVLLKVAPSYDRLTNPGMVHPYGLAVDATKGHLYVASQDASEVLRYDAETGEALPVLPALDGVSGIDAGTAVVVPEVKCHELYLDDPNAPLSDAGEMPAVDGFRAAGGAGGAVAPATNTALRDTQNTTLHPKKRSFDDSALRGIAALGTERLLLVLAKCQSNKYRGGKMFVVDMDTGDFLDEFDVDDPRDLTYVPAVQRVFVTGRDGIRSFLVQPPMIDTGGGGGGGDGDGGKEASGRRHLLDDAGSSSSSSNRKSSSHPPRRRRRLYGDTSSGTSGTSGTSGASGATSTSTSSASTSTSTSTSSGVGTKYYQDKYHLVADNDLLQDPWYHTGNGIASDGNSLWVIAHGARHKGQDLNSVRNSTLLQFDLATRARVKVSPIPVDDFPESLAYSPC